METETVAGKTAVDDAEKLAPPGSSVACKTAKDDAESLVDEDFFDSYGSLDVHAELLKDKPRMEAYVKAIEAMNVEDDGPKSMRNKVVMDVGAGSGFLAMMCATRGAAKCVHAVEANPRMASVARNLILRNGLIGKVIVHNCKVEDLKPEALMVHDDGSATKDVELSAKRAKVEYAKKPVDIIVSEWMGYYLVQENMLPSVLYARDTFLKPARGGGLPSFDPHQLLPSSCTIYTAPLDLTKLYENDVGYFSNLFGLDFSAPFGEAAVNDLQEEAKVDDISQDMLLAPAREIITLDLLTLKEADLVQIEATTDMIQFTTSKHGLFGGVGIWFDCFFGDPASNDVTTLSTSPCCPSTHWKQTIVFLQGRFVQVPSGEELAYAVVLEQSKSNPRQYIVGLQT